MTPDRLRRLRLVAEAAFTRDRIALARARDDRRALAEERGALAADAAREAEAAGAAPDARAVLSRYLEAVDARAAALAERDAAFAREEARRREIAAAAFRRVEATRYLEIRAERDVARRRALRAETEIAALHALRRGTA